MRDNDGGMGISWLPVSVAAFNSSPENNMHRDRCTPLVLVIRGYLLLSRVVVVTMMMLVYMTRWLEKLYVPEFATWFRKVKEGLYLE